MGTYVGVWRVHPFLCYVRARDRAHAREGAWLVYVSEALRLPTQNKCLTLSYGEFLSRVMGPAQREDRRSGDEIAADVIGRIGLEVTG
ncbi:hypothetical protein [Parolsenella catena]|uniref:hypothetical protein n=1 Tax=Parolsenella catena TaxID=2003188 RepID=UPI003077C29A